ncbi:hypothetical protein Zmor_024724 [Zophobas morio]|uniref:Uncharacterized protein n=1 Tax=Zophobas morio TaxID=2755281 RepID=A0AA38I0Q5_9CUCU|nr:hypothetical protein Zmor_024724 [Zophobas morio]
MRMYLNLHIYIFWILVTRASTDVVTLIKNESITCVLTEESVYSALYISPNSSDNPLIDSKRTLSELTQWVINDWNVSTTQELPFYPVVDVRWEEFPNVDHARINVTQTKVTSFSLCFYKKIVLNAVEISYAKAFQTIKNEHENVEQDICQWSHYTLRQNQMLEIEFLETAAHETEVWKLEFDPKYLAFPKSRGRLTMHQYGFRYSRLTTLNDVSSFLDISNLSNFTDLCISLFVSVDENCYLDVVLESGTTSRTVRVDGFNLENKPKFWKQIEIHTNNYNGTGKLNFYRFRNENKREGFWAIDKVHICRLSTGTTCDQSCTDKYWGRDCASTINSESCESYNNTVGCFKCTKKFTGRQCAEKLPVVLKPPTLVSTKTNFAEISIDLTYGEDEKEPDFYQIQYKESNGTTFKNFSDLVPFQKPLLNRRVTIPTSSFGYKIRVLLFVGNEHYEDGVPELVTTSAVSKNWYIGVFIVSNILSKYWISVFLTVLGIPLLYVHLVLVFRYFFVKKERSQQSNSRFNIFTVFKRLRRQKYTSLGTKK